MSGKTRIAQYWTRRSDSFLEQRRAELHSALAGRWMAELKKYLPEKKNLRILDVGCGTGFFTYSSCKGRPSGNWDRSDAGYDHSCKGAG